MIRQEEPQRQAPFSAFVAALVKSPNFAEKLHVLVPREWLSVLHDIGHCQFGTTLFSGVRHE